MEKKNSTFHLFGNDFMIDSDLNVQFLEVNTMPGI